MILKIYFNDYTKNISASDPLDADVYQALDIFDNLPQNDGSHIGIITKRKSLLEFYKFNKFVWIVELHHKNTKKIQYASSERCKLIIKRTFTGLEPSTLKGFKIEKKDI